MFNSHRDDRRRRALADDRSGETQALPASTVAVPKASGKQERYTSAARRENHRRVSDFVPRGALPHVLWWMAGIALSAGLLAGYATLVDSVEPQSGSAAGPLFQISHGGSLIGWFSSTLFTLAAVGSVLVYSIRRHRLDDYRGSYRLWLWSAAAWLIMSIDATANLHTPFSQGMAALTGWTMTGNASVWWIGVWGLLITVLALRMTLETRECRSAMFGIVMTFAVWAAALAIDLAWIPSGEHATLIAAACRLAGQAMLMLSIGLYARHVLLDAEGMLPERAAKPPREKKLKQDKAARQLTDDADSGKSMRVDSAHKTAEKRTDLQPHTPAAQSNNRGPLASRVATSSASNAASASTAANRLSAYDDEEDGRDSSRRRRDSEDDDEDEDSSGGGRKMSRAERKKLRKMQRQQRDDD